MLIVKNGWHMCKKIYLIPKANKKGDLEIWDWSIAYGTLKLFCHETRKM